MSNEDTVLAKIAQLVREKPAAWARETVDGNLMLTNEAAGIVIREFGSSLNQPEAVRYRIAYTHADSGEQVGFAIDPKHAIRDPLYAAIHNGQRHDAMALLNEELDQQLAPAPADEPAEPEEEAATEEAESEVEAV